MNKYIKTDIEQGITFLKIAINNAFNDLETRAEKEICFEVPLPLQLIIKYAKKRGWIENMQDWDWTNGWEIDYWFSMMHSDKNLFINIDGSILCGNSSIKLIEDDN